MKKLTYHLAILSLFLFLSGCGSGNESSTLNDQSASVKVAEFLKIMITDQRPKTMIDFIAPSYIKAAKFDPAEYTVNTYYPKTYKIEEVFPSPDLSTAVNVVAVIYGENEGWAHRLTFVVFNDNGKLVFYPGSHDTQTKYIDPWYRIQEYVQ